MGKVADELEGKLWEVAGPGWVRYCPNAVGETCLVVTKVSDIAYVDSRDNWVWLSSTTELFLAEFIQDYSDWAGPIAFNDYSTQEEVVWMLEEAIDEAKELGL